MCIATVAEISHIKPLQAIISQLSGIAQALQNGVHKALQEMIQTISRGREILSGISTYSVPKALTFNHPRNESSHSLKFLSL